MIVRRMPTNIVRAGRRHQHAHDGDVPGLRLRRQGQARDLLGNQTAFWMPDPANPDHIKRVGRVQDVADDSSEMPHILINQARLHELFLEVKLRNLPSRLEPDYSWEVVDLAVDTTTDDHPVTVTLKDASGVNWWTTRTVRANYVVGCDGAHSAVRKAIGGTLHGDAAHQAWGVMDIPPTPTSGRAAEVPDLLRQRGQRADPSARGRLHLPHVRGTGQAPAGREGRQPQVHPGRHDRRGQPHPAALLDRREGGGLVVHLRHRAQHHRPLRRPAGGSDRTPCVHRGRCLPRTRPRRDRARTCRCRTPSIWAGSWCTCCRAVPTAALLRSYSGAPDRGQAAGRDRPPMGADHVRTDHPGRARRDGRAAHHPPVQSRTWNSPGGTAVNDASTLFAASAHQALARRRDRPPLPLGARGALVGRPADATRPCRRGRRALAHLYLAGRRDGSNAIGDPQAGRLAGEEPSSPVLRHTRRGEDIDAVIDFRAVFQQTFDQLAYENMPSLLEAEDRQARSAGPRRSSALSITRAPATSSTCAVSTGTPDAWSWSAPISTSRTSCRSTPATNWPRSSPDSCADRRAAPRHHDQAGCPRAELEVWRSAASTMPAERVASLMPDLWELAHDGFPGDRGVRSRRGSRHPLPRAGLRRRPKFVDGRLRAMTTAEVFDLRPGRRLAAAAGLCRSSQPCTPPAPPPAGRWARDRASSSRSRARRGGRGHRAGSPPCSPQTPSSMSGRTERPLATAISTSWPTPFWSRVRKGRARRCAPQVLGDAARVVVARSPSSSASGRWCRSEELGLPPMLSRPPAPRGVSIIVPSW